MPLVSVLIPAHRPAFFETCVASVMTQTLTDFELLIGDDSVGDEIHSILSQWDDPRIQYSRHPAAAADPSNSRERLLSLARGAYVKFLSDDDMLFPQALETQVQAAQTNDAGLVFTNHCLFDTAGQLTGMSELIGKGKTELVAGPVMFLQMIGRMNNFIGPLSNVLFERAALCQFDTPFCLDGQLLRFHGDVAAYMNFAQRDFKIVGVGELGTAVRRHAAQYRHAGRAHWSAGLFEWELLLRWAIQHQRLTSEEYLAAMQALFGTYQGAGAAYSELQLFLPLRAAPGADGFLGQAFREVLKLAYLSIDLRRLAATPAL